ncbi:putative FBD domain-containing protein [Medicago truncatula]|uniref:Putative FBD domain-containing protein n=1 Tax=Medicago truncatula TaxID=3880 RepID=A0A396I8L9_MEDTR|nr:putative FBD domain-containing protein [Medicago truncatula]
MSKEEIKSLPLAVLRRTENTSNIRFDTEKCCQPNDVHMWVSKAFVNFALLRRTESIRKLRLHSDKGCQPHDVHLWVSKALDLKVQELDLDLFLHEKILLPLRLSTCESLVVLKLRGRIQPTLNSSFHVYLPSLKILHIRESCSTLQINAPSLEVLSLVDYSSAPRQYEYTNLSNLDEASIFICKRVDFNNLYTFLKGLSNVKSLALSSKTFHFLSMEDKLDNLHLLTFHNLLFLWVEISKNWSWNMLVSFLQNAPKLKDLAITRNIEINSRRKEVGNPSWVEPLISPTCLRSSLITFEFVGIQNIKTELDFTRYIVSHSSKLQKVKIFTPTSK